MIRTITAVAHEISSSALEAGVLDVDGFDINNFQLTVADIDYVVSCGIVDPDTRFIRCIVVDVLREAARRRERGAVGVCRTYRYTVEDDSGCYVASIISTDSTDHVIRSIKSEAYDAWLGACERARLVGRVEPSPFRIALLDIVVTGDEDYEYFTRVEVQS